MSQWRHCFAPSVGSELLKGTAMSLGTGSNAWRMQSNNGQMISWQREVDSADSDEVTIDYYGGSAFRITSPRGITVLVDPWRNHPSRSWDWFFEDFPRTRVNIGLSTHAHFDHDALHRLDCDVAIERLVGTYMFADVCIHGIADKHAIDCSCGHYDYNRILREINGVDIRPPNNPRSWDNSLIVVEVGGLRILHWGDNRGDPPEAVWEAIGQVDIALLPVDDSRHVLGYGAVDGVIEKLDPTVVIPHHYYIWDVLQRHSTLLPPENWVSKQSSVVRLNSPGRAYTPEELMQMPRTVHYFGEHVNFDKEAWRRGELD